jgi:hypothetical protein
MSSRSAGGAIHPSANRPIPQEIDQVGGVTLVVLHSAVAPVVAERMGKVNLGSALFEYVCCLVPPIARFKDHFGVLAGLGDLGGQGQRVVVDPDRVVGLTSGVRRTITLRRRCKSMPTYCC